MVQAAMGCRAAERCDVSIALNNFVIAARGGARLRSATVRWFLIIFAFVGIPVTGSCAGLRVGLAQIMGLASLRPEVGRLSP